MLADGITIDAPYFLGLIAGAGGVIAFLFRLLIASRDRELQAEKDRAALELKEREKMLAELEGIKKSYAEIAAEALKSATETANYYRHREGKPPIIPVAPVISESHSPSTAAQRETAAIATLRAKMAQVKVASNQTPREEPPQAQEPTGAVAGSPPTLLEAVNLKEEIKRVPERVVDEIEERERKAT